MVAFFWASLLRWSSPFTTNNRFVRSRTSFTTFIGDKSVCARLFTLNSFWAFHTRRLMLTGKHTRLLPDVKIWRKLSRSSFNCRNSSSIHCAVEESECTFRNTSSVSTCFKRLNKRNQGIVKSYKIHAFLHCRLSTIRTPKGTKYSFELLLC